VLCVLGAARCGDGAPPGRPAPRTTHAPRAAETPRAHEPRGSNEHDLATPHPDPSLDALPRIANEEDFLRLAAPSREHAVARVLVVKLLWDLDHDTLHFCQSDKWPLHYDYAVRFLADPAHPLGDRRAFNTRQYLRADRRFVMATVAHYVDANVYTLELGPADTLDGERVRGLLERVERDVYFGAQLVYRPRSELHARNVAGLGDRLPMIDTDAVWRGVRYQPLTLGTAYGHVRVVHGALEPGSVRPDQILVTEEIPDDMPLAAALVTGRLQTPLAHVAVLSHGRGTPNMALVGAPDDARFAALDGRLAQLVVGARDFTIAPASEADARRAFEARRGHLDLTLPAIDRTPELRPLDSLRYGDVAFAGAKAAQLGEVYAISPRVETPGGFVVPVHHYLAHLEQNGIDVSATSLARAQGFADDQRVRARVLGALRARIAHAPVSAELVRAVHARISRDRGRKHIFRSSTNAEDLVGWSGAGLYESVVVAADATEADVARALAEVWASVYTDRAFSERSFYGVDHDRVAMAVLVQPFLDDVVATGVAITENPFSDLRSGILVNVQTRGGSVTATTDELPEQVLLYRHTQPEILSRSTRTGGAPILGHADLVALRDVLDRIHAHFVPLWGARADAADIELAVTAHPRRVVILQARPWCRPAETPDTNGGGGAPRGR